jgi:ssDNA-binding Zn-finger/Zn-ribbon topoisomerase 1
MASVGRPRFWRFLAGIVILFIGIVGLELVLLVHFDYGPGGGLADRNLTEPLAQAVVIVGGFVFIAIGAVILAIEFHGYRMCPSCGKETFDLSLSACPQCGRQLPQKREKGV